MGLWMSAFAQESTAVPETASADQQRFADGLLSRGLYDMAIEEYRQLLTSDPDYAHLDEVLFRMAEAFRKQKNGPAAERMYLRVIREFPDSPYQNRAAFRRAELYIRGGKYLEAVNLMRALLEKKPEPDIAASASYYAAYSMKRINLPAEAEQQFKVVIEKYRESPYRPFAALELASMYRQKKSTLDKASAMYAIAAKEGASERVRAEALFQQGDMAYAAEDFKKAVTSYTQLREAYPKDQRVPEAALQTGWSLFRAESWSKLIALCDEEIAPASSGGNPVWLYFLANGLRVNKSYSDAMKEYQRFLTRSPDHRLSPAARYEEALCAFAEKDYQRVVARLEEGSWKAPLVIDRTWLLAQAQLKLRESGEARDALQAFLKLDGTSARAASAKYELARFSQTAGELDAAADQYRALQSEHPKLALAPRALYAAGYCMAARDDFHKAIRDWNLLMKTYPESDKLSDALFQKALAQVRLERFPSAKGSLKDFLKLAPKKAKQVEAQYWLGQVHEELEELDHARKVYQAALDQASGHDREGAIRFRLAGVMQAAGDTDAAAAMYQDVLDSPQAKDMPPSLMEWLARQNLEKKAGKEAVQAAKALVEGRREASWTQIGYFLLGRAELLNGDRKKSIQAYQTAFELPTKTPEGVQAGLALGELYLDDKQADAASEVLSQVVEKSREDGQLAERARATFLLGRAAELEEDLKSASRYYMSVAILYDDPELSPEALYRAAEAFGKSGATKESQHARNELTKRYPESDWAKKAN